MNNDSAGASIRSESDAEQKIILPLLTSPRPNGLGYDISDIFTKVSIKGIVIDKGRSKKNYFPDFVVTRDGLPLIVVEAKAPGEDLHEALREARLYAGELNSGFGPAADPVKYVLASDGLSLLAGYSNSNMPEFDIPHDRWSAVDIEFSRFVEMFSEGNIENWFRDVMKQIRPDRFWKPRKMVGGLSAQDEEIGLNSFGVSIKSDFRELFSPSTLEEREVIARECYIPSKRRDRYVDAIDRTFKAIISPSEGNTVALSDSSSPKELISKLRRGSELNNEVMLLIGAAGSGKTTFVDHLRVNALPADLRRQTRWLHINMNDAPVSRDEIYPWLRSEIIKGIKSVESGVDFDSLDSLRKIFKSDVERFRKGVGRLYESNKEKYDEKLAEVLTDALSNEQYVAQAYCKYVSSRSSALIVIALDNCDKRLMDEQLLMFEAAQWIRKSFSAMVFLPLREETYDNNLDLPPLDTALKDLAFRIEPPRFDLILRSRVDFAIKKLKEDPNKKYSYDLPNSMKVVYTASEKISYLRSILSSLFDTDSNIRRLLIGLSGRNMRRAMEIFLDFCSSGHISEDHIVKMAHSSGSYKLPMAIISRVLLRSKKRYYDSDHSYVVNVFSAEIDDARPNFFVRIAILRSLANIAIIGKGPRTSKYARVSDLFEPLKKIGVTEGMLLREVNYLTRKHCLISEDFRLTDIQFQDTITIGPAGRTHLYLLGNIHYLSAVSEDTWFRDKELARSISDRIRDSSTQFDQRTVLQNAESASTFLRSESQDLLSFHEQLFLEDNLGDLLSTDPLEMLVGKKKGEYLGVWSTVEADYPTGAQVSAKVKNRTKFGIFLELSPGVDGLAHISALPDFAKDLARNDMVAVDILSVDAISKRIVLRIADRIVE